MLISAKEFYDYDQRESGNIIEESEFVDDDFWYFFKKLISICSINYIFFKFLFKKIN